MIALGTSGNLGGLWMLGENASEDTLGCCVIFEEGDCKESFCGTKKIFLIKLKLTNCVHFRV